MSPERLLQHFGEISEAPDAIPRLRRFILDLAVRGKLVAQDPGDEPAETLFARIAGERARLIKAGEIKKAEPAPTAQVDELPFEVPTNWLWVRLAQFAILETGKRMQGGALDNGVISLGGEHVKPDGSIDYSVPRYVSQVFFDQMRTGRLALADTVMVKDGATTGKTSFVEFLPEDGKAAINEHVFLIRPFGETNKKLVYLFVRARAEQHVKPQSQGVIGGIRRDAVLHMPVPFPPLAEQHRIVAKVDELMVLCDELAAARAQRETRRDRLVASTLHGLNNGDAGPCADAQPAFKESARFYFNHLPKLTTRPEHIKQLRQTILNLAVRGKLVEQDLADEPAAELLKRIVSERAGLEGQLKTKKPLSIPAIDKTDIPFLIPATWSWVRLIDILIKLTDGTHHSPSNSEKGDFMYVTAKNIKPEGVSLAGITYVSEEFHNAIFARCNPAKGDILYVKDGATTGVVTINNLDEPFSMLSSVALLKTPDCVYNQLLIRFLRSPFFYAQMRGFMKGAAITRVTLKRMAPALIPLPPLAEQHRIVAKVDELMALCNELETRLAMSATLGHGLLEAVLNEVRSLGRAQVRA